MQYLSQNSSACPFANFRSNYFSSKWIFVLEKPKTPLITYIAFSDEAKAAEFESYLKSGSGRAFAIKRFW